MNRKTGLLAGLMIILLSTAYMAAAQSPDRFIDRWALTIPSGSAGWLGIEDKGGYLDGSIMWGGGSVKPVDSVYIEGKTLYMTRLNKVNRKDADGNVILTQTFTETITATVSGDKMELTRILPRYDGKGTRRESFTGKRIPAIPPKPDLSKAKRGKAIKLFNGRNLDGWKLTDRSKNEKRKNGWSVKKGVLIIIPSSPKANILNMVTSVPLMNSRTLTSNWK